MRMKPFAVLSVLLLVTTTAQSAVQAQEATVRMAQKVEEMFPPTPKPAPQMQCPPDRGFFASIGPEFMDRQNLCLRAGRPFYLVAKEQFRVCYAPLLQCPRERQVDRYVHKGMWVTVLERKQGLLRISYESGEPLSGYADPKLLEAPQSHY